MDPKKGKKYLLTSIIIFITGISSLIYGSKYNIVEFQYVGGIITGIGAIALLTMYIGT